MKQTGHWLGPDHFDKTEQNLTAACPYCVEQCRPICPACDNLQTASASLDRMLGEIAATASPKDQETLAELAERMQHAREGSRMDAGQDRLDADTRSTLAARLRDVQKHCLTEVCFMPGALWAETLGEAIRFITRAQVFDTAFDKEKERIAFEAGYCNGWDDQATEGIPYRLNDRYSQWHRDQEMK